MHNGQTDPELVRQVTSEHAVSRRASPSCPPLLLVDATVDNVYRGSPTSSCLPDEEERPALRGVASIGSRGLHAQDHEGWE